MSIDYIPLKKLRPNTYNPNRMTDEDFKGLVESIKNAGFLDANPILVRPASIPWDTFPTMIFVSWPVLSATEEAMNELD